MKHVLTLRYGARISEIAMPARINKIRHDDETRAKIQTAHIVRRLTQAFNGEVILDGNQISIGIALLRKTLPDLSQVESHNQTELAVISDKPLSPEAWEAAHGEPVSNPVSVPQIAPDHKNVN